MREPIARLERAAVTRPTPEDRIWLPRQSTNLRRDGRETKLTSQLALRILGAIREGSYRDVAAQAAGMRPETLSRWLHREGEPYETFSREVECAEADAECLMVRVVTKAAKKDARYAVAFLERKFPE